MLLRMCCDLKLKIHLFLDFPINNFILWLASVSENMENKSVIKGECWIYLDKF